MNHNQTFWVRAVQVGTDYLINIDVSRIVYFHERALNGRLVSLITLDGDIVLSVEADQAQVQSWIATCRRIHQEECIELARATQLAIHGHYKT